MTATISDATTGDSNVVAAEFFIDIGVGTGHFFIGQAGTTGYGTAIIVSSPSPTVSVPVVISSTVFGKLKLGNHTLYIHGKDAAGNWGNLMSVVFTKNAQAAVKALPTAATYSAVAGSPASNPIAASSLPLQQGASVLGGDTLPESLVGNAGARPAAGMSARRSTSGELAAAVTAGKAKAARPSTMGPSPLGHSLGGLDDAALLALLGER